MAQSGPFVWGEVNRESRAEELGRRSMMRDVDASAGGPNDWPLNTGMEIEVCLVQNTSGAAVLPGEAVGWDTAAVGQKVGSKAAVDTRAAGIVDPFLPSAGAADDDYHLIITKGPATVIHAGNDTITSGDRLMQAAAGRFDLYDGTATAATENLGACARAMATPADDNAGTKFRAYVDFPI